MAGSLSCQKKLVCELYEKSWRLGSLGARGRRGLDVVLGREGAGGADIFNYITPPDAVLDAIDEFRVSSIITQLKYIIRTLYERSMK